MTDQKIAIMTCYWSKPRGCLLGGNNFSSRPVPQHPLLLFSPENSQDQRPVSLFTALA
jgi:hypothetical protein